MFVKTGDEMPIMIVVDGTVPEGMKQEAEDKMEKLIEETESKEMEEKKN